MPCGLQDEPLEDQILYLQKGQLVLFELKYGTPITEHLNPQYLNRTWKDPNSLSVFFKGIQINDEGEYNCIVLHKTRSGHSKTHSSTITLNTFKDFSVPVIIKMTSDSYLNCGVPINLTCISSQGYPEDTLSWDIKAKNATWQDCEIIKTEAVRDPHTQLFNLTSVMQISLTKTLTICCSVRNSSIVMEVKCNDTVRIDPIVPPPSSRHATGTGIAVCFFVLLLIGIIIRKVVQQE
ncbi:T-lymphocyte activation antigen CD86-like isoform X3 [Lepisosteus oculatus]|nr:PREDICTED: T-lymphocyte activation antigen CD86-like isoform X3 [Lepisosteus oculatus]